MNESSDPDVIRPTPEGPLEYEADRSGLPPAAPRAGTHRTVGPWPLIGLVIAVAAFLAGGYFLNERPEPVPAAVVPAEPPSEAAPPRPLGASPFPADVPALDLSDSFVRQWVPRLSSHPQVAAWLATDGLIRNFTTVVANIAEGLTPAGRLPVLKPSGPFRTVERGDALVIDPRSYARYDALASAFASLDAEGAAQLYATLKPRIEEAHAELGAAPGSFDGTLERAIVVLLQTPVSDGPLAVEPAGIGYRFADDRLESLTGAQRHLLRMGPVNARLVQRELRTLALALGIPASRLPPAPVS